MDFTLQGMSTFLYVVVFIVLIALAIGGAYLLYRIASLPGQVAAARGHPQAAAIAICGWLGIVTLVLWPIAMVWAYTLTKEQRDQGTVTQDQLTSLLVSVRQISERIAAIERSVDRRAAEVGS
jgi:hypothetical protein